MLKQTRLRAAHERLGARLVDFAGWEMPLQYGGIVEEHQAVRQAAGLFDISHMGEFLVSGGAALAVLNGFLTNDLRKLAIGQGQYSLMCNENGGVIDDLYVYCLSRGEYLMVVNASRIEPDFAWLSDRMADWRQARAVALGNVSEQVGAVAVQGPKVADFINECFQEGSLQGAAGRWPSELKKNQIAGFRCRRGNALALTARTGYTGEDGFEIIVPVERTEELWNSLLEAGQPHGLRPAGLGARDTLRTEMCYPLYGHELDEQTTPLEAGLERFVSFDKGDFLGRKALEQQKLTGVSRKCIAFKATAKGPAPRPGCAIWASRARPGPIGLVVSGTHSPSLGLGIGLGYVAAGEAVPETSIQIEVRDRRIPAAIVPKPIYRR
jgi:aminomethyltransferase